jgi:hypothetical protein
MLRLSYLFLYVGFTYRTIASTNRPLPGDDIVLAVRDGYYSLDPTGTLYIVYAARGRLTTGRSAIYY